MTLDSIIRWNILNLETFIAKKLLDRITKGSVNDIRVPLLRDVIHESFAESSFYLSCIKKKDLFKIKEKHRCEEVSRQICDQELSIAAKDLCKLLNKSGPTYEEKNKHCSECMKLIDEHIFKSSRLLYFMFSDEYLTSIRSRGVSIRFLCKDLTEKLMHSIKPYILKYCNAAETDATIKILTKDFL